MRGSDVGEHQADYGSEWAAMTSIGASGADGLQSRGHLAAAIMDERISGRVGEPEMGRLAQQSLALRAHRHIPPAEADAIYYINLENLDMVE